MEKRKRRSNQALPHEERYAELQRVRLGTRLPAYLPMRISEELLEILRQFKETGQQAGIKQFIIQTHFQTPLEITLEAKKAIRALIYAGWTVTNQLAYNVSVAPSGNKARSATVLHRIRRTW